jgi:DCN1-like protein 1/2
MNKEMEENIAQFCGVTGASVKDARRFLDKHKRVDIAMDAFYNDAAAMASAVKNQTESSPSTSKLNALFNTYKDADGDDITMEGTMRLCEDLGVDPDEDCVLYAIAYELGSPRMGEWNKKGWTEGWKSLGCDSIPAMKSAIGRLRDQLGSDPEYFQKVYNHTFDFARSQGQRSIPTETAQAFWATLLPHGLQDGALSHIHSKDDDDDDDMGEGDGWRDEYVQWWFDFLNEKGGKGISRDTWVMFTDFVRTIDSKFEQYDIEAAWPSTIDDFVEWAKARLGSGTA